MTIRHVHTVIALIAEDPRMRVYRYQHALSGHWLYAAFPLGQHDDMAVAPNVLEAVLLYDHGHFTAAGKAWLAGTEEAP